VKDTQYPEKEEERKLIFLEHLETLAEAFYEKFGGFFFWTIHPPGIKFFKASENLTGPIWVASIWVTENWESLAFLINPKEPALGTLKPFIESLQEPGKQKALPQK